MKRVVKSSELRINFLTSIPGINEGNMNLCKVFKVLFYCFMPFSLFLRELLKSLLEVYEFVQMQLHTL